MSETQTGIGVSIASDRPLVFGVALGLVVGAVERFLVHFELTTLAVALVVVGVVLSRFGDRSTADIGRALTAVGVASLLAFQALVLVFG